MQWIHFFEFSTENMFKHVLAGKKTVWRCGGLMSVGKYKSQRKPRRGDVCPNVYYHFRQCETLLSSKQANEKQCNVAMTTAVYFHCTRSKKNGITYKNLYVELCFWSFQILFNSLKKKVLKYCVTDANTNYCSH